MATAVLAETLDNTLHSAQLISESRSYTEWSMLVTYSDVYLKHQSKGFEPTSASDWFHLEGLDGHVANKKHHYPRTPARLASGAECLFWNSLYAASVFTLSLPVTFSSTKTPSAPIGIIPVFVFWTPAPALGSTLLSTAEPSDSL
jgi:hypothetical protein